MIYITVLLSILYLVSVFLLEYGYRKIPRKNPPDNSLCPVLPFSVIIACKNEQFRVKALFDSLLSLDYPRDKFEIIFIDDNSTDRTADIIEEFIKQSAGLNIRMLKAEKKKLPAKKGALQLGVETAQNEYIMITDADCSVPPRWLRNAALHFSAGAELIIGAAPFRQSEGIASLIACYEQLRNSVLSFALGGYNIFYTAAARSFGYSRELFRKVNGYYGTADKLSGDDDLFIREAVRKNAVIRIMHNPDSPVLSDSPRSWQEYFTQRGRHISVSASYSGRIKALLASFYLIQFYVVLCIPLSVFFPVLIVCPIIKALTDFLFFRSKSKDFGYSFQGLKLPFASLLLEFLLPVQLLYTGKRVKKWRQ